MDAKRADGSVGPAAYAVWRSSSTTQATRVAVSCLRTAYAPDVMPLVEVRFENDGHSEDQTTERLRALVCI